jgi:hypothetical protein
MKENRIVELKKEKIAMERDNKLTEIRQKIKEKFISQSAAGESA